MELRDRVVKLIRVKAGKLIPSPWNWRVHPDKQKQVLRGILGEVGIAGVQIARQNDEGDYILIDGHLRKEEYPPEQKVPVLVVDLDEEEAKKLLACYDPIGALAETDQQLLGKLLQEVETRNGALASLFSHLMEENEVKLDPSSLSLEVEEDGEEVLSTDYTVEPSHVRMVQLFLDTTTLPEFEEMMSVLAELWGTENFTDTVMTSLRKHCQKKEARTGKGNPSHS